MRIIQHFRKIFLLVILFSYSENDLYSQNNTRMEPGIEYWQKATVSIGTQKSYSEKGKKFNYYSILGTGIFTYVLYRNKTFPMIVTAKHVIQKSDKSYFDTIRIRLSWEADKNVFEHSGYRITLFTKDKVPLFFSLPDSTVDLVAFPIAFSIDTGDASLASMIPHNMFATHKDFFEGRELYCIGYPSGMGSEYWTRGLLRKGIISWLPPTNIESRKFLIDCNVYPGNSGGPVFSLLRLGTITTDTTVMEDKFLGIVIERKFNENEVIEIKDKKRVKNKSLLARESLGVGVVEPATNVYRLLKHAEDILNKEWNFKWN